jgi:hypothetical protein
MDSLRVKDEEAVLDREIERYREAATDALDQLEWCAEYLYRVGKPTSRGHSRVTGGRS